MSFFDSSSTVNTGSANSGTSQSSASQDKCENCDTNFTIFKRKVTLILFYVPSFITPCGWDLRLHLYFLIDRKHVIFVDSSFVNPV